MRACVCVCVIYGAGEGKGGSKARICPWIKACASYVIYSLTYLLTHSQHTHTHTHTHTQYDEQYTEADILQGWSNVMEAYGKKWNVFALDLKNEPNGIATWVSSARVCVCVSVNLHTPFSLLSLLQQLSFTHSLTYTHTHTPKPTGRQKPRHGLQQILRARHHPHRHQLPRVQGPLHGGRCAIQQGDRQAH